MWVGVKGLRSLRDGCAALDTSSSTWQKEASRIVTEVCFLVRHGKIFGEASHFRE
jgi:hypothetical protein